MNDIDKRIKKAKREAFLEAVNGYKWAILIFFCLAGILIAFIPISSQKVIGVVVSSSYSNTEVGNVITLTIELSKNHQVRAKVPNNQPLKVGANVELIENTSLLFDIQTYRFIQYVD